MQIGLINEELTNHNFLISNNEKPLILLCGILKDKDVGESVEEEGLSMIQMHIKKRTMIDKN